jgi:hypothetical protein
LAQAPDTNELKAHVLVGFLHVRDASCRIARLHGGLRRIQMRLRRLLLGGISIAARRVKVPIRPMPAAVAAGGFRGKRSGRAGYFT